MSDKTTDLQKIAREAFLDFFKRRGVAPPTLAVLAASAGISGQDLKAVYPSMDALEGDIWLDFLETTLFRLNSSEEYADYLAREKALAFYYTFLEVLDPYRTYAMTAWQEASFRRYLAPFLEKFRLVFDNYVAGLIKIGNETLEVPDRPIVDSIYPEIFWIQFIFVLNYWLKDRSPEKSQTDAAVEKAVNLSFDLIGHTPLDSLFDFGKFIFQKN